MEKENSSLINRAEIRRLEKAAKEKDKKHLVEWAKQLEDQIRQEYNKQYEQDFKEEIMQAIDNFMVAIAYTLHFSENTKLGPKRLPNFMEELFETVDLYRKGEFNPLDYQKELEKCGILLDDYQYSKFKVIKKEK